MISPSRLNPLAGQPASLVYRPGNLPQADFNGLMQSALKGGQASLIAKLANIIMLEAASRLASPASGPSRVTLPMPSPPPQETQPPTPRAQPAPQPKALLPAPEPQTNSSVDRQYIDDLIRQTARRHGVDPSLVRAVVTAESDYDNWCVSPAGAQGLMQLMPETAADLGVKDSFDPAQNIEGGTRYLAQMLERFQGDQDKALAAYNWGPGNVERGGRLPRETRDYLVKIDRFQRLYAQGFSVRA